MITGTIEGNRLSGDAGDDVIYGGAGNDTIFGGAGDDTLSGGLGVDDIYGGAGFDTIDYTRDDNEAVGYKGHGFNINLVSGTTHTVIGNILTDAFSNIESVIGSDANDIITGNDENNRLSSGAGNDIIHGNNGGNVIYGGAGDDTLSGGGSGALFLFEEHHGSDVILDFKTQDAGLRASGLIDLARTAVSSFDDLTLTQNGTDTIITGIEGTRITLSNIDATSITGDDFIF